MDRELLVLILPPLIAAFSTLPARWIAAWVRTKIGGDQIQVLARKTDAEIAQQLRDDLLEEIARLRAQMVELEEALRVCEEHNTHEIARLNAWILRLEQLLRSKAPADLDQLRQDYLEEAANDG